MFIINSVCVEQPLPSPGLVSDNVAEEKEVISLPAAMEADFKPFFPIRALSGHLMIKDPYTLHTHSCRKSRKQSNQSFYRPLYSPEIVKIYDDNNKGYKLENNHCKFLDYDNPTHHNYKYTRNIQFSPHV